MGDTRMAAGHGQRLLFTSTPSPTPLQTTADALEQAEVEHTYDAVASLWLNVILIVCILAAYAVKHWRLYYLPESALAIGIGMIVGVIARVSTTEHLELWVFQPELFFFVFLPPIIFEAGYSLNQKDFFDNIGAIVLFAMVGTIISTFTVGGITWYVAQHGWVTGFVVEPSPMEALLFGALISAVDPVATLSIMGNAELRCDRLLYSLVFGESVLNDAIAISLFRVFADYYEKENSADAAASTESSTSAAAGIFSALIQFTTVSASSIAMGAILGLAASAVYRHTGLRHYPKLETSLLFLFCYTCYSLAEAVQLSGIMALFFQGMVLSHYNSYNLSAVSVTASEQIFATLATLAETAVFLYMGIEVFTGRFQRYDVKFCILSLFACWIGRAFHLFPLSMCANAFRSPARIISRRMQVVLWFAGLRGAIAFALAVNMPGANREIYATTTLFICIFTTVVCGSLTDRMLTSFGMKQPPEDSGDGGLYTTTAPSSVTSPSASTVEHKRPGLATQTSQRVYKGAKKVFFRLNQEILQPYFGGPGHNAPRDQLGNYELSVMTDDYDDDSNNDPLKGHAVNGDDDDDLGSEANGF